MDIAMYAMNHAMQQTQNQAALALLGKTMDTETQTMEMLLNDFAATNAPAQMLAPKLGSMNIRV